VSCLDQIIASFGQNNLSPDEMRRIVEDAWKNGTLTLFYFKMDSLFQNVLRALNAYDKNTRGFGAMVKKFLQLAPPKDLSFSRDVLLSSGALRNSFHNNAFIAGENLSIKILDMQFDLRKDVTPKPCIALSIAPLGGTFLQQQCNRYP
jgi:hypothetical protein